MKRTLRNSKGITLVELVIAIAIVGVVMLAAFSALTTGIKSYNANVNGAVGQENLRAAMTKISRDVRNPANTVTVTGSKALSLNGTAFTVSSGRLMYNGSVYAGGISSISADWTDASHKVIQVDLGSTDGNTLSTQVSLS